MRGTGEMNIIAISAMLTIVVIVAIGLLEARIMNPKKRYGTTLACFVRPGIASRGCGIMRFEWPRSPTLLLR